MRSEVQISAEVDWTGREPAAATLLVRAAFSPDQEVLDEHLEVTGAEVEEGPVLADGARPMRIHTREGPVALRYRARVRVEADGRVHVADSRALPEHSDLPFALLPWTLPSRYAPSDVLAPTAQTELGLGPRQRALLPAAAEWVRSRIAYTSGASDAYTAADETLLRRQGVCRDMAHLGVSLLRAMDVPARVVACYAPFLEPPDFHALVEAHDGEAWRLMDATGLAPVESVVRIATGRDAADVAWATGSEALALDDVRVSAVLMAEQDSV
ncbi:MAG: transglutaminase family protein [Thermoleophilia bacterium]